MQEHIQNLREKFTVEQLETFTYFVTLPFAEHIDAYVTPERLAVQERSILLHYPKATKVSYKELLTLHNAYLESEKTIPQVSDEESFEWGRDSCGFPKDWRQRGGWDSFMCPEPYSMNTWVWFAEKDGKYYRFIDVATLTDKQFIEKMNLIK